MRIAFTGVSHWHLPLYLDPVLDSTDPVVGVSDPVPEHAKRVGEQVGCPSFTDWQEMLETVEPEFVFVLGRHVDMAEVCRYLLNKGIPFAVEKPAGINAAEVIELEALAKKTGTFAAVPLVFRQSKMVELIEEVAAEDAPLYMTFKFVAGSTERYRATSDWMLSRATSGGGSMINLGIHFIDLANMMLGPGVEVAGAMMSNALDGFDVEDHGTVLLRAGAGGCVVETGYIYPAPHMTFDMHFSVRTGRHHFAAVDNTGLQVISEGKEPRFAPMPMTNIAYYPVFVRDVLERVREGRAPVAGLTELAEAMKLLDTAYALAPLPPATRTP